MPTSDPGLYARSFADVYDDWYANLDNPAELTAALIDRVGVGGSVVEFGAGTGRLAAPLQAGGLHVTAVDISSVMLDACTSAVHRVVTDIRSVALRTGSADAVILAFNTIYNLASVEAQLACLHEARRLLKPAGYAGIETMSVPAPDPSDHSVETSWRPAQPDAADGRPSVLLLTETSQGSRGELHITGCHLEFGVAGATPRPWRLCAIDNELLDHLAARAGLTLDSRHRSWSGDDPTASPHAPTVSWYSVA